MRAKRLVVLLGVCSLLVGCGDEADSDERLPTGSLSIDGDTTVWVDGRTAHVGGTTLDLRPKPDAVVAGASGLYYLAEGVLYVADDSGVTEIGKVGDASQLRVSPDRRYVGYVDFGASFGSRVAESVVIDTATGEQLFRTPAGNGDTGDDDLGDLYAESVPRFVGFDERAGYVVTASGDDVYRLPLDGGDPENLGDGQPAEIVSVAGGQRVWVGQDGRRWTITGTGSVEGDGTVDGGSRFPGGPYATANSWGPSEFFDVDSGREVDVRSDFQHVVIGTWTGPTALLGVGFDGDFVGAPPGRSGVVACSLETRTCETLGPVLDYAQRGGILFATGESTTDL